MDGNRRENMELSQQARLTWALLALLTAFVAGFARRWSYGLVLLLHAVSTLSSWRQYLHPFEGASILFFAAWPMLAACLALYALRDSDTLTVEGRQQTNLGRA